MHAALGQAGPEGVVPAVPDGHLRPVDDVPGEHLEDQVDGAVGAQGAAQAAGGDGQVGGPVRGLLQAVADGEGGRISSATPRRLSAPLSSVTVITLTEAGPAL